jgi:hypothetical protein
MRKYDQSILENKKESEDFVKLMINIHNKRLQTLEDMLAYVNKQDKPITEKQLKLIRALVPYIPSDDEMKVQERVDNMAAEWMNNSGSVVKVTKNQIRDVLPDIVDHSTAKFLSSLLTFSVISQKQEVVLTRIWDEISNQGMYLA